jgi:hypothetical protein
MIKVCINVHSNIRDKKLHGRIDVKSDVEEKVAGVLTADTGKTLSKYRISDATYDLDFIPISRRFRGKGVVRTLSPSRSG